MSSNSSQISVHQYSHITLANSVGNMNTEISDEVVDASLAMMRAYSNQDESPYIQYFTPAQIHLRTYNFNQNGDYPKDLIPMDKSSITIHPLSESSSHWVSSFYDKKSETFHIYDSLKSEAHLYETVAQLRILYGPDKVKTFDYKGVTQQSVEPICGVMAIAFALTCLEGRKPEQINYDIYSAREHLKNCFLEGMMKSFPTQQCSISFGNFSEKQSKQKTKNLSNPQGLTNVTQRLLVHDILPERCLKLQPKKINISTRQTDELLHHYSSECGFDLSQDFLNEENRKTGNDSVQKKTKGRSKQNSRTKREKDRERKRIARETAAALKGNSTNDKSEKPLNKTNVEFKAKQTMPNKQKFDTDEDARTKKKRIKRLKYSTNVEFRAKLKSCSKLKYAQDTTFQDKVKANSKTKYANDADFQDKVKANSKTKYVNDADFRDQKKSRSKLKYAKDADFQEKVKANSKTKYTQDADFQDKVKANSKTKYVNDADFRDQKKSRSKLKYAKDADFQENVKAYSKTKYVNDADFQDQKKSRSQLKYAKDADFQEKVKANSKTKYTQDADFQEKVKAYSKTKYTQDIEFQANLKLFNKHKYTNNIDFKLKVKQLRKQRYANNTEFKAKVKRLSLLRYRRSVLVRETYRRKQLHQYHSNSEFRRRRILSVQQQRSLIRSNTDIDKISAWFKQKVRNGPKYICCVCHKFMFTSQVVACDTNKYSKKGLKSQAMAKRCISYAFGCDNKCQKECNLPKHKLKICHTCHRHLLKGELPVDAAENGLHLGKIPKPLKDLNSLEKQLVAQRIPFMKLVQLPKGNQRGIIGPCVSVPTEIQKTVNTLPRCQNENQLLRCKLKRKLSYKGHSQYEFVSSNKINKGLHYLFRNNPLYKNISLNPTWQEDLEDISVNENRDLYNAQKENNHQAEHNDSQTDHGGAQNEENEDKEDDDDQNVRSRGLPSDTCLQPVDIGQEILDQYFDDIFCVAPGEGKTPVSMLQEKGNECMSFPVQFPVGMFGSYDSKRQKPITHLRYFHNRLMNADTRFSTDSSYIFFAQYLSELEQVISKVSIAMRKSSGKDQTGNTITANMLTDKGELKKLLTSDQGYKFLTPIRGTPPYWQATLKDLMAMIRQIGIPTWFATFSAADLRWTEVLELLMEQQGNNQNLNELDWTAKSEVLRKNPVMTATIFNHRFHTFLKEIIIKKSIIGKVKDHFHRIEFQQRGSPHAHCLFWIEDAPLLDDDNEQMVCEFIDRYVHCNLPDETKDPVLYEIVKSVQSHSKNHSKSCKKKGTECRFNFPRPPSKETFISQCQIVADPDNQQSPEELKTNAKNLLLRLWTVLHEKDDFNTVEEVFNAAGITQRQFEMASNTLCKRTNVTLKRRPSDLWINQYNPDLLRCWNANMDIQYVTDPYSCVMYIISYISKAEREMGVVLENARKEAAEGNCNAQDAMKKIGGAYFRQREVSAQEAAYRVCGLHLKESSRKVQFVPVGENQIKMSLPLNMIKRKASNMDEEGIWMISLYDRYKARPMHDDFENLCYASFCSEYRILSQSQIPKKASQSHVFQLQNNLGVIRKRTHTDSAVIRYPRFSELKSPELFYQSILQLFLPHRQEIQLKPNRYKTFQEMFNCGTVIIKPSAGLQSVKSIVTTNRKKFEVNADALDEAQEMLDIQGPLEDAWALIAPESELERLETRRDKINDSEDNLDPIPELDNPSRRNKGNDIEIRQTVCSTREIIGLLRQLNTEQKSVFYCVRQWCLDQANGLNPEPFRLFITGGAGTGKSHLIKCLFYEATKILSPHTPNPDDVVVMLTAPTATAAFNIGGTTLHQAFGLTRSLPLPYMYKRDDELNKLRSKFQHLRILIIDEISMVGQRVLLYVNERLRQIKQSGNALFGNICIIAVGDFYQLPPVKQKCLHDLRSDHYFSLWSDNFSLIELSKIMRQKNDVVFAQMLNRLRTKRKKEQLLPVDLDILQSCSLHTVPRETIHIFGTNKEVGNHNAEMIIEVCEETEILRAQDYDKEPQTGRLIQRKEPYTTTNEYLPSQIVIGKKARVMLLRNIDILKGLVNGAIGTVVDILPRKQDCSLPQGAMILFDNDKIGKSGTQTHHRAILISPFEETLNNNAVRYQFPMQLAWACTTHKVQGMTMEKAVVSMKHIFAAGMAYVGLSRVTSMAGLVIQDFNEKKIYCNEQVLEAMSKMPKFLKPQNIEATPSHTILLHNVEGLKSHFTDIQVNTDMLDIDVICMTETWLKKNDRPPVMENMSSISKSRFDSYSGNNELSSQLKSKKHGGVAIYVKENKHYTELNLDNIEMECVGIYVIDINTNIAVVYRPEAYTVSAFLGELNKLLDIIVERGINTILLGDFNQDILKSNSSIQTLMAQKGFKQLVQESTTDGNTLIDHVYLNGDLQTVLNTVQTYYSYHNIVNLQINYQM